MKKTKSSIKPKAERRKRGEHLWHESDGVTKCITCFCDEDDAFVGGQECSYKQKEGWKPE